MTDDGGLRKAARTFLLSGLIAVLAVVGLVMLSGRDPGRMAASGGGVRLDLPWLRSSAVPNT